MDTRAGVIRECRRGGPGARVLAVALVLAGVLPAANPVPAPTTWVEPYPFVVTSPTGKFYFRMLPDADDPWKAEGARGQAYRVDGEGDELLWEVSGWYAFQLYLSNDGRDLVRIHDGPPRDDRRAEDYLAVAFYRDGELVAEHSTLDLIADPSDLMPTSAGLMWRELGVEPGFERSAGTSGLAGSPLRVVSWDHVEHVFDSGTGELIERRPAAQGESR